MPNELSILIPVFNFDIRQLVASLLQQCQELGITFEILCADDGSCPAIRAANQDILVYTHTRYEILPSHHGRVAIRNRLAQQARYAHLLFLDNDSQVVRPDFIYTYLEAAALAPVLLGGTCYQTDVPATAFRLRWRYGRRREERSAASRNRTPYQSFYINNIFLARQVFLRFPLQALPRGYGHEDSLFGSQLEKAGIPVLHLDNPVLHAGLEPAEAFLAKSRLALENLHWLYRHQGIGADTRLLRLYRILKKWRLLQLFRVTYQAGEAFIQQNLLGPAPALWLFDLYKLYHFSRLAAQKESPAGKRGL